MLNLNKQLIVMAIVDVAIVAFWLLREFNVMPANMIYDVIEISLDLLVLIVGRYIYVKNRASFKTSSFKWFVIASEVLIFLP